MFIGILFGKKMLKYKEINEKMQLICVVMLIFLMGISLGKEKQILENLLELGLISTVYAIIPIIFSTAFVYILTEKYMKDKEDKS